MRPGDERGLPKDARCSEAGDLRQAVDLLQDVALSLAPDEPSTLQIRQDPGDVLPAPSTEAREVGVRDRRGSSPRHPGGCPSSGVASCSSRLATRPLRSRKRRSSTNASLDSIWRARALRRLRDAAGSEARKARNPSERTAQTSESSSVNTLAVRSLSARTPSSPTNVGVVDGGVEDAVAGDRDRRDLHASRQQEEDLIGRVPLVAEVGTFAVVAEPPLVCRARGRLSREVRPARGSPPSLPRSRPVGSSP